MFEVNETKGNLKVACIGKTAEIWNKQSFAKEYELLEGNPLESAAWENVDIGFLLADAERNEDVTNLKKAVAAAKDKCIPVLIPILISTKPVNVSAALLTINPENHTDESEIYKSIYYAMKSINDIACLPGMVTLDIQDIMSICKDKKSLQFSMSEAKGENATISAVRSAMNKMTKQDEDAEYANMDILLNVTGSEDCLSMYEIQEACEEVYACLENNQGVIIWGASIDDSLGDVVRVSILMGRK